MTMRISWTLAASIAWVLLAAMAVGGQSARQRPTAPGQATTAIAATPARAAEKPAAASAPKVEKPVPFKAGEVLTYDVSFSGALSAGEATISVREKRPSYNSTAYYIVADAKPTGLLARIYTLYYKADTLVDVFTLLPQRGSFFSLEGRRSRQKTTMFNQQAGTADYELKTASLVKQPLTIAPSSQDALSMLIALRTAQLQLGRRVTLPLCDGGRQYRVTFAAEGRETLKTAAITASAWRLNVSVTDDKGQPQGRAFYIWVSDDVRHLPLKLKADLTVGSFVVELTKVVG
jgi:hypothetical protein